MLHLGLIGENIAHSKSPIIHKALLEHTGISGHYGILDVAQEALPALLLELKEKGYRGVNVTVPHKQNVLPFLDELHASAQALQAVNTIVFDTSESSIRLLGYNTDVSGFWASIPKSEQQALQNQNVLLLGAGGAARAVLAAILPQQPKALTIAGQSPNRLADTLRLAETLKQTHGGKTKLATIALETLDDLSPFEWVINATPIGTGSDASPLSREQVEQLPATAYISDLVYHPAETQLLKLAHARGLEGQNGLGMLIHQAIAAFTLWSNIPLNNDALECVEDALSNS